MRRQLGYKIISGLKVHQNFIVLVTLLLLMAGCHHQAKQFPDNQQKVEITDMAGRKVLVPKEVHSLFGADNTVMFFLEALAPELLIARNNKPSGSEALLMPQKNLGLPAMGMIFYGKSTVNIEELASLKPDILLCPLFSHTTQAYIADFESYGKKTGAAVVMIDLDMERLPEAFRFMGKLLGKTDDAEKLAAYCEETLDWAASVRAAISDTVSVYIAEGTSGLQTIPANSTHSQTFRMAGVKNCAEVDEDFGYKEMSISMEQVLAWNPDYILVNSRASLDEQQGLIARMKRDPAWTSLNAVKKNHILTVPTIPHNWIGRPPGINRLIGIRWLASALYPEVTRQNMEAEIVRFFTLFYHVTPTSEQLKLILNEK